MVPAQPRQVRGQRAGRTEQDQRPVAGAVLDRAGDVDLGAPADQVAAQRVGDHRLVVHDEDPPAGEYLVGPAEPGRVGQPELDGAG